MKNSQQTSKSWKENIGMLIAVTTVILAVCATLASFKAAGYGNRMVLMQNQASDQWAYYQAKSIKETTYQVQRDTVALTARHVANAELYTEQVAEYDKEIARYKKEKTEITNEAKRLEQERDSAKDFNGKFGRALIFLQVGILLSSLASINKVYIYWYLGILAGGLGVILFLYTLAYSGI